MKYIASSLHQRGKKEDIELLWVDCFLTAVAVSFTLILEVLLSLQELIYKILINIV